METSAKEQNTDSQVDFRNFNSDFNPHSRNENMIKLNNMTQQSDYKDILSQTGFTQEFNSLNDSPISFHD
jgi:hypothetical protein